MPPRLQGGWFSPSVLCLWFGGACSGYELLRTQYSAARQIHADDSEWDTPSSKGDRQSQEVTGMGTFQFLIHQPHLRDSHSLTLLPCMKGRRKNWVEVISLEQGG